MRTLGWALIQSDWYPHEKRKSGNKKKQQGCTATEKYHMREYREGSHLYAKENDLRRNSANPLILDFQPPEIQ